MEKQIIYNVLDGEITFDPQIVEYGRLREEFNDYDDELAQSISKFYEENKSSIMDMYLGENKYYDFMFRLYAEITENIKEHMKKYINIMIDHGVYDVEEDYFTSYYKFISGRTWFKDAMTKRYIRNISRSTKISLSVKNG